MTRAITRPLAQILQATAEVGDGNLDYRARVSSDDEIGRLTSAFNDMTRLLQQRTGHLERMSEDALLSLSAAIDARDRYNHRHSIRVAAYSLPVVRAAGLSRQELEVVRRGCLVHDIGKIGIPDRILTKAGPLDAEETAEMRRHPTIGRRLLNGMAWEPGVFDIVLHHHERWDGTGYPTQLMGDAIPRLARIVALAYALDALTTDRPYPAGPQLPARVACDPGRGRRPVRPRADRRLSPPPHRDRPARPFDGAHAGPPGDRPDGTATRNHIGALERCLLVEGI
ncbi:MAG: HD domain-containing phosphohydrolase [Chloroflexota bacterium]